MYEPEECFETAAESRACEYVICSRLPTKSKKSIREGRRRERRNVVHFTCVLRKHARLRGWSWQKTARTRQSFENAPESRAHEYVTSCAPPNTKEEEYSRAKKSLYILRVFYVKTPACNAGFSIKCTNQTVF